MTAFRTNFHQKSCGQKIRDLLILTACTRGNRFTTGLNAISEHAFEEMHSQLD